MKKLCIILPITLVFCFIISCEEVEVRVEGVGAKALTDEDIAAIKAIGPALDEAAVSGDWDALVALFTEDVSMMGPNSPITKSRSALMELLQSSGMTVSEHKVEFVEVYGYGDLAYGTCKWTEKFGIGDTEPISEVGKILGILRKQPDGNWLISHWSWNSDLPLPE